jgi:post-segregation antitoxin (ccd killing protein)
MRTTITLDEELARRARALGINISEAARRGVANAVRSAMAEGDRRAYERKPEQPDPFWEEAEAWTEQ